MTATIATIISPTGLDKKALFIANPTDLINDITLVKTGNAVLNPSAKLPAALNLSNINIPLDIPPNKGAKPFANPPIPILKADNAATPFKIFVVNCGCF